MNLIEGKINGIPIYINKTDKIKNIHFRMYFVNELSEQNVTSYALLCRLLTKTTKKYNTKSKISKVIESNYNLNFMMDVSNLYKTRVTKLTVSVINGKYIKDNKLTNKALKFFSEILLNPNVEDGKFSLKSFAEEKKKLRDQFNNYINNKDKYAFRNALKEMFPDDVASMSSQGKIEDLDKITPGDVYQAYLDLLNNTTKTMYITGDVDQKILKELGFVNQLTNQDGSFELAIKKQKFLADPKVVHEKMNVNQARLVIGYKTDADVLYEKNYSFELFSSMLGEMQSSSLFQVIREQNSLAYSVECNGFVYVKSIFIIAGIDKEDYQKCLDLVKEIITQYQNGVIDNELLRIAKENKLSGLDKVEDYPPEYVSYHQEAKLLKTSCDFTEMRKAIEKVTVSDIKEIAQTLMLDTIYLLSNNNQVIS